MMRVSHDRNQGDRRANRNAFTLLEVLLAVGLTTLLMAALYQAMSIYWTTAVESHDEIERAQIARALFRQMSRDILSCTFSEQEETLSSEEDDTSLTEEVEMVDPETALGSYTNGLFGSDKDLVLYINRPDRDQNYVLTEELMAPSDRSGESMIVRYLLAEEGGAGLAGEVASEYEEASVDPVKGLAVMKGDLSGLSNAISLGDLDMQLAATDMLAQEVAEIEFSYFDGVEELPEWDSTAQNSMPLAIRIRMVLRSLPNPGDDRDPESIPGYIQPTEHLLVVPIPVAAPYVDETAL